MDQSFTFSLLSNSSLYVIVKQALHTIAFSVTSSPPSYFGRASNMKHVFTHISPFSPTHPFRPRNGLQSHDAARAPAAQSLHCKYVQAHSFFSLGSSGDMLRRLWNISTVHDSMLDSFEIWRFEFVLKPKESKRWPRWLLNIM